MKLLSVRILGKPVNVAGMEEALAYLSWQAGEGNKQFIVAQNPEKVMKELEDPELDDIIENRATLRIADGTGLLLAGKILGLPALKRVTGVGLFAQLVEVAAAEGKRVFLYGAAPQVVEKAAAVLKENHPGLLLAGTQDGYEKDMNLVLARIKEVRPDFLFVALGSPKQEKWIAKHFDQLPVQLVMGVGGTFDVLAGNVKRAPVFFQKLGLEWFYRLLRQPARAKRMANLPVFLWLVLKEKASGK